MNPARPVKLKTDDEALQGLCRHPLQDLLKLNASY